jgi:hypothetical protein
MIKVFLLVLGLGLSGAIASAQVIVEVYNGDDDRRTMTAVFEDGGSAQVVGIAPGAEFVGHVYSTNVVFSAGSGGAGLNESLIDLDYVRFVLGEGDIAARRERGGWFELLVYGFVSGLVLCLGAVLVTKFLPQLKHGGNRHHMESGA